MQAFTEIAEEVEWLHVHEAAAIGQVPRIAASSLRVLVASPLDMDFTAHVLDGVIDYFMPLPATLQDAEHGSSRSAGGRSRRWRCADSGRR